MKSLFQSALSSWVSFWLAWLPGSSGLRRNSWMDLSPRQVELLSHLPLLVINQIEEDAAAREAALAGARAFYTVDTSTGQQQWLNRLCTVSTQTGCTVYQEIIVPNLWNKLVEGKTVTTVEVSCPGKDPGAGCQHSE